MFGEKEFNEALKAYQRDKSTLKSEEFYRLLKGNRFFSDISGEEDVKVQIRSFTDLISRMDRDNYTNRYVLQRVIMEFCAYLDKDFLFNIKEGRDFYRLKSRIKEFTGEIYNNNKKFTQNINQNSLEHLLEDYGTLLRFKDLEGFKYEEDGQEEVTSIWSGNKLW